MSPENEQLRPFSKKERGRRFPFFFFLFQGHGSGPAEGLRLDLGIALQKVQSRWTQVGSHRCREQFFNSGSFRERSGVALGVWNHLCASKDPCLGGFPLGGFHLWGFANFGDAARGRKIHFHLDRKRLRRIAVSALRGVAPRGFPLDCHACISDRAAS